MSATTHELPQLTIRGIAIVGRVVTYRDRQFKVNCVEGRDFFACESGDAVKVDLGFPEADWILDPIVTIVPVGRRVGEGFSEEAYLRDLRVGVCLAKSWV